MGKVRWLEISYEQPIKPAEPETFQKILTLDFCCHCKSKNT